MEKGDLKSVDVKSITDKSNTDSEFTDVNGTCSIRVKVEPGEDTIKNYAENTMNELLGLFGYDDKINSADTKNLNLDNYADGKDTGSDVDSDDVTDHEKEDHRRRRRERLRQKLCGLDANTLAQQHLNLVTALKRRENEEARESKEPASDQHTDPLKCAWCRKPGNKQFSLEGPSGTRVFCSEVCFTQCRRASFKRTRICDWCKHVRHAVDYVELTEGDTQVQFCTEKCLNQYKMSIFCKETQEHLQKMADKVTPEDSSGESDSDRAILITPDLWLSAEKGQAADLSKNGTKRAPSRREHKTDAKDASRAAYRVKDVASTNRISVDKRTDSPRVPVPRGVKSETAVRHRKVLSVRERSVTPPPRTENQTPNSSPNPQAVSSSVPPNAFHPALSGMAPWFHPAQFMGAMASGMTPGMVPFPGFSSLMLQPGMVPHFTRMLPPEAMNPNSNKDKEPNDNDKKSHVKMENHAHAHKSRLLSPTSDRSSISDTSSPNPSGEKRTSSLFPVDFPQLLMGQGFAPSSHHPAQSTSTGNESEAGSKPAPDVTRIPPVTMMVPFPVIVPFPVPIPIPVPLTYQQLKTLFGHDKKPSMNGMDRDEKPVRLGLDRVREERSPRSPRSFAVRSPMSVASSCSDYRPSDPIEIRSGSRNSCPDLSQPYGYSEVKMVADSLKYLKRSRTPDTADGRSLDLSQSTKRFRYELVVNGDSVDGAIDLSSTRDNNHGADEKRSENSLNRRRHSSFETDGTDIATRDDGDSLSEPDGVAATVPKIHIITHEDEPAPLNQPLPLPPTEKSYSTRRGLILDAPAVPKKSRSPSPQDRRLYVRNVPRDIIEAARRRCMRTRIRTK